MRVILFFVVLMLATPVYADVDITITVSDRTADRLDKLVDWGAGTSRKQITKSVLLLFIEQEKRKRFLSQTFNNMSATCALPGNDCAH